MARWQYIGYHSPSGTYSWSHYWAWTNGQDVATMPMDNYSSDRVTNIPPGDAERHYDAVDDYDGDIFRLMDDWGITGESIAD